MLRLTRSLAKQFNPLVPCQGFATRQKKEVISPLSRMFYPLQASAGSHKVTLLAGDGIGPEIAEAVMEIFSAAKVPIDWEHHNFSTTNAQPGGDLLSAEALDSIRKNKVALKGIKKVIQRE